MVFTYNSNYELWSIIAELNRSWEVNICDVQGPRHSLFYGFTDSHWSRELPSSGKFSSTALHRSTRLERHNVVRSNLRRFCILASMEHQCFSHWCDAKSGIWLFITRYDAIARMKKSYHTLWRYTLDMTISHIAISQSDTGNYFK